MDDTEIVTTAFIPADSGDESLQMFPSCNTYVSDARSRLHFNDFLGIGDRFLINNNGADKPNK